MTINHVHLAATDVAKTQAFYEDYFDFQVKHKHGNGVFLQDASGFLIALDPMEGPAEYPPWFHLGFCLDAAEEVHALHKRVIDGNAKIVRKLLAEPDEFASFYLADPDGCRIEVSWHAE